MTPKLLLLFLLGFIHSQATAITSLNMRNQLEWEDNLGCGPNCETCSPILDVCSQCGPELFYSPTNRLCQSGGNINCKYFKGRRICRECNSGYKLAAGGCQQCVVANCRKCSIDPSICDMCLSTHTNSNSTANDCLLRCRVANCDLCVDGDSQTCKTCLKGFRLASNGTCEQCKVANCVTCQKQGVNGCDVSTDLSVKSCTDSYYWGDGKCESCMNGCLFCNRSGICLKCDTSLGFYMFNDMRCKGSRITGIMVALLVVGFLVVF